MLTIWALLKYFIFYYVFILTLRLNEENGQKERLI